MISLNEKGSLDDKRLLGAQLIEAVLNGSLSPEEALERWPLPIDSTAHTLTVAWTHLEHFRDDHDLHERDVEYAQARRLDLSRLADKLRSEASELGDLPS